MSPDEERWAEATTIERIHGAGALAFVAERIRTLREADDLAGVERFAQIGRHLVALGSCQGGRA